MHVCVCVRARVCVCVCVCACVRECVAPSFVTVDAVGAPSARSVHRVPRRVSFQYLFSALPTGSVAALYRVSLPNFPPPHSRFVAQLFCAERVRFQFLARCSVGEYLIFLSLTRVSLVGLLGVGDGVSGRGRYFFGIFSLIFCPSPPSIHLARVS